MQPGEGTILPSSTVTANIVMLVKFIAHKQFRLSEKRNVYKLRGRGPQGKDKDLWYGPLPLETMDHIPTTWY